MRLSTTSLHSLKSGSNSRDSSRVHGPCTVAPVAAASSHRGRQLHALTTSTSSTAAVGQLGSRASSSLWGSQRLKCPSPSPSSRAPHAAPPHATAPSAPGRAVAFQAAAAQFAEPTRSTMAHAQAAALGMGCSLVQPGHVLLGCLQLGLELGDGASSKDTAGAATAECSGLAAALLPVPQDAGLASLREALAAAYTPAEQSGSVLEHGPVPWAKEQTVKQLLSASTHALITKAFQLSGGHPLHPHHLLQAMSQQPLAGPWSNALAWAVNCAREPGQRHAVYEQVLTRLNQAGMEQGAATPEVSGSRFSAATDPAVAKLLASFSTEGWSREQLLAMLSSLSKAGRWPDAQLRAALMAPSGQRSGWARCLDTYVMATSSLPQEQEALSMLRLCAQLGVKCQKEEMAAACASLLGGGHINLQVDDVAVALAGLEDVAIQPTPQLNTNAWNEVQHIILGSCASCDPSMLSQATGATLQLCRLASRWPETAHKNQHTTLLQQQVAAVQACAAKQEPQAAAAAAFTLLAAEPELLSQHLRFEGWVAMLQLQASLHLPYQPSAQKVALLHTAAQKAGACQALQDPRLFQVQADASTGFEQLLSLSSTISTAKLQPEVVCSSMQEHVLRYLPACSPQQLLELVRSLANGMPPAVWASLGVGLASAAPSYSPRDLLQLLKALYSTKPPPPDHLLEGPLGAALCEAVMRCIPEAVLHNGQVHDAGWGTVADLVQVAGHLGLPRAQPSFAAQLSPVLAKAVAIRGSTTVTAFVLSCYSRAVTSVPPPDADSMSWAGLSAPETVAPPSSPTSSSVPAMASAAPATEPLLQQQLAWARGIAAAGAAGVGTGAPEFSTAAAVQAALEQVVAECSSGVTGSTWAVQKRVLQVLGSAPAVGVQPSGEQLGRLWAVLQPGLGSLPVEQLALALWACSKLQAGPGREGLRQVCLSVDPAALTMAQLACLLPVAAELAACGNVTGNGSTGLDVQAWAAKAAGAVEVHAAAAGPGDAVALAACLVALEGLSGAAAAQANPHLLPATLQFIWQLRQGQQGHDHAVRMLWVLSGWLRSSKPSAGLQAHVRVVRHHAECLQAAGLEPGSHALLAAALENLRGCQQG